MPAAHTLIGYTRSLAPGEDLTSDIAELKASGAQRILMETDEQGRKILHNWLAKAPPGRTLMVTSSHRLGDGVVRVLGMMIEIEEHGHEFRSLTEPSLNGPEAMRTVRALHDVHRGTISRRTREQMKAGTGRKPGRPLAVDAEGIAIAHELRRVGRTVDQIAHTLGVSTTAARRALATDLVPDQRAGDTGTPPLRSWDRGAGASEREAPSSGSSGGLSRP